MTKPFILLVAALVLAGCATSGGGTSSTPTPTSATPASGGSTNATIPVKSDTHDFATDAATGAPAGGQVTTSFTVPAGVTTLNVTVDFTPDQGAPASASNGISVQVGKVTCALAAGPVMGASKCAGTTPAADAKTIAYSGAGPVTAKVTIVGM